MKTAVTVGCTVREHVHFADGSVVGPQYTGNALYSAAGMLLWLEDVGVVSTISRAFPESELNALRQAGMETSGIRRRRGKQDFEVDSWYDAQGERLYKPPPGVLGFLEQKIPWLLGLVAGSMWRSFVPGAADIPEAFLPARGAMICSSEYRAQAELAARLRPSVEILILDPPSVVLGPPGRIPKGMVDLSIPDYVLPSEQELVDYFGPGISAPDGIRRLQAMGARNVVLKQGSRGCLVVAGSAGGGHSVPVYPARVVDPTGAGDAFCGGFLAGLLETGDALQAALYGTVSASFVIEHSGILPVLAITREQAEERLARLRQMV